MRGIMWSGLWRRLRNESVMGAFLAGFQMVRIPCFLAPAISV